MITRQGPGRTQCHFHCQTHYTTEEDSPPLLSCPLCSAVMLRNPLSLSLSLHAEMSWAHQKLLGARLYAYRGNMHNAETRKAATEKEYFNCVVRVSDLTVNSQQKENC